VRPSIRRYDIMFDNQSRDDEVATVSTYTLNRLFHFAAVGDDESVQAVYASAGHTICACLDLRSLLSHFLFLSLPELTSVARAHYVPTDGNKPVSLQATMNHICSDICRDVRFVFTRRSLPGLLSMREQTIDHSDTFCDRGSLSRAREPHLSPVLGAAALRNFC
jgi:hypothetical protein